MSVPVALIAAAAACRCAAKIAALISSGVAGSTNGAGWSAAQTAMVVSPLVAGSTDGAGCCAAQVAALSLAAASCCAA